MIKNYKNQLIGVSFFIASILLYFATDSNVIHTISGGLSGIGFCFVFKAILFETESMNEASEN